MKFREAFGIEKGDVVALIGAGGKTTLMVGIGYELAEAGWRVLATTTARMPEEQLGPYRSHCRYQTIRQNFACAHTA